MGLDLVIHPSAEAQRYGWSEAFGPEPLVYSISRSGRGERNCAVMSDAAAVVRFVPASGTKLGGPLCLTSMPFSGVPDVPRLRVAAVLRPRSNVGLRLS